MKKQYYFALCLTDRGSAPIFFVAFVLPLFFFLISISLDVASYYSEEQSTQKILDDAGMYAYRFLPYQSDAVAAAQDYLGRYGNMVTGTTISVVNDGISLQSSHNFSPFFAGIAGAGALDIPVSVVSEARGTPLDVFVALDVSSDVAPAINAPNAWGNSADWPAAPYFSQPIFEPSENAPDTRVLTQQCFNPAFSVLKQAAVDTIDYLGGFSLNAIGAGFYSGNPGMPIDLARAVGQFPVLPASDQTSGEVQFVDAERNLVSSVDCAAAGEGENGAPIQYQFPPANSRLPARGNFSSRPIDLVTPGTRTVDSAYLPYLQTREVIWSQVARDPEAGAAAELLQGIFGQLISAPVIAARRGLAGNALKVGIIFASGLPRELGTAYPDPAVDVAIRGALENSFLSYATHDPNPAHVRLIYVLLQPDTVPDFGAQAVTLQKVFDDEAQKAGISADIFSAHVFYVHSYSDLTGTVMQSLAGLDRSTMVSL